ncbi:MAG TPA: PKD domain-containing protein, partial [Gemmatimonadales bacterium]|nr:PKD domain-containing protein [Gemmatimonadales bacterium]
MPERQGEGAIAAEPAGTVAFATASTDDGLTITTDKDDYQPGDIVHLTGRGWPGDDSLDILLEDAPATHAALRWTIATDGDGSFQDSTYVVDEGDLDVTFTLTATSRASGRSLSVTFTDGNLQTLSLNPASRTTTPTGSASYTINVGMGGSGTTCTVTLSVLSLPALPSGANASIPNNVVNATDQDFSRTLTITTSAVAPGTYPFTVQAGRGANCQGNGNVTVNGTLVVSGPAAKLVFSQPPSNENAATPITPAITVSVLDAGNNLVTGSTAAITLSIGTNSGGGTLSGTLTQNAVNGVATFSDVSIDKQGNGYTLIASSPGLTQVTSVGFAINRGPAAKLAFTAQPSGGSPGGVFPGQPSIAVQDAGGNLINSGPGSGSSITLTIEAGTGTAGAALTCNANPLNASNGVATFANCRINLAGIGYRLRATSGALAVAVSDLFDITASNQAPNVDAGGPYTVVEGTELTLAPSVSDADADPLTYEWSVVTTGIDANGTCTFVDATVKDAKLTCTDDSQGGPSGKFSLSLEVSDGVAATVTDVADLTVTNAAPVAAAGGPYSGSEGSAIGLNGSADDPGDNDDAGLTYAWSVNTNICTFDNATKKNAEVTCTDNGTFTLTLKASDDDGDTSPGSTATLTISNDDPVADAGGPYTGKEGDVIGLDGTVSDAGAGDTHVWSWEYVSGPDDGGSCTISAPTAEDPTIKCTDDGVVKLTLTVTDDDGGTGADEATLTLANVAPTVLAGGPYGGDEGEAIQLTGSFTDPGSNDTHTKLWTAAPVSGVDAGATCSFLP